MRIFGILLAIIIVIALVYSGVRWIAGEVSFGGFFSGWRNSSTSPEVGLSAEVNGEGEQVTVDLEKPSGIARDIPLGFTAADLSPDFGRVEITSLKRPSSSGTGGGFTLRADTALKESLNITNWKIRANSKKEIVIKGDTSFSPPVNLSQIVLRPRTSAVFYAGVNSVVKNVELNKCTGYLNNVFTLNPKLPNNCPRPDRSEAITFSGDCQDFVRSLSSCEQPTGAELSRFTKPEDLACRELLRNLNYGGCINDYSGNSDFYSYGWRVWTSDRLPFDPKHDRLLLLDENNLIVDEYIY
ncbi:MAG: hypothetical protein V2A55_02735 [Candidatus Jorgensenbacteria bacterium]